MGVRYYWPRKKIQIDKKRIPWSKNDVKSGWLTCLNRVNCFTCSAETKINNASTTSTNTISKYTTNSSSSENYFQDFDSPPSSTKIIPPLSIDINLTTHNSPPNNSSPIISTRSSNRIRKKNQFLDDEMWLKKPPKKITIKKTVQKSIITNNLSSDDVGFKFAKKIGNKGFWTGTIVEIFDGSPNYVTRRRVYDDGDEENLSKKQIPSLERNSSHIKHTIFNETLSSGDVRFKFRKLFKNNSFYLGTISEIRLGAENS